MWGYVTHCVISGPPNIAGTFDVEPGNIKFGMDTEGSGF